MSKFCIKCGSPIIEGQQLSCQQQAYKELGGRDGIYSEILEALFY